VPHFDATSASYNDSHSRSADLAAVHVEVVFTAVQTRPSLNLFEESLSIFHESRCRLQMSGRLDEAHRRELRTMQARDIQERDRGSRMHFLPSRHVRGFYRGHVLPTGVWEGRSIRASVGECVWGVAADE
jgi:hypothetical protein